jgi:hypothetical protein
VREQGGALGRIHVYRSDDKAFTPCERRNSAAITSFIVHAQTTAADVNVPLVTSPNSGVIIAELSGRVQHLSKDAHRLLWIATHPGVTATQVYGGRHDNVLPEEVRRLYRKLVGVFKADSLRRQRGGTTAIHGAGSLFERVGCVMEI